MHDIWSSYLFSFLQSGKLHFCISRVQKNLLNLVFVEWINTNTFPVKKLKKKNFGDRCWETQEEIKAGQGYYQKWDLLFPQESWRNLKPEINKLEEKLTKGISIKINKQMTVPGIARLVIPLPHLMFTEWLTEGFALEWANRERSEPGPLVTLGLQVVTEEKRKVKLFFGGDTGLPVDPISITSTYLNKKHSVNIFIMFAPLGLPGEGKPSMMETCASYL